ncbi:MAG: SpoIID/LytB domain-containing protein [Candidatus Aminicenantes bacterium]|nr:MAG: SpoIID/LytB domain-containing protein [Candidatus Aminicenantes bacterium]
MRKSYTSFIKYFIILVLSFFVLGGQPVEFGQESTFFHGYLIETPIIRVGLGINLSDIQIASSSGMKIYEINSHYKLIAEDVQEAWIKGRKERLTEKFVIQVAQTKDWEEAEIFAQELRTKTGQKVYVKQEVEETLVGTFQVKIGDFLTRGDALNYIVKLNQMGIDDTWILREEITAEESKPLWILVNDELKSLHDETVLYFIPRNPQSYLSYNGRDYRGLFILKATRKGIVLVNVLNIEDYIRAVVPSELSPYNFRQLEAHKAQAVAARTYAFKNLGSNEDLGYDLCDTPSSQFYKGMNAEHPLSSDAVEETRGEVATYKGKLIDALYTSTCGGMTENVEDVFMGPALPYLRRTECVYEKQKEWHLRSSHTPMPIYIEGKNIAPAIAGLISLNIIPPNEDPFYYREEASFDEALRWIDHSRDLLGKKNEEFLPQSEELDYASFADILIHGLGWQERVDNLLLDSETDFILKSLEGSNGKSREFIAYLVQAGIFPDADLLRWTDMPLRRGEMALYLWRALKSYEDLIHQGIFKELDGEKIILESDQDEDALVLLPDFYLLKNLGGEKTFSSQLFLLGGEKLKWIEKNGRVKLLEVVYPAHSNILDRDSVYHSWHVRRSKEKLEKRINQYYPIGKLIDLIPIRRGDSHRLAELLIMGSETQAVVKGLRIRRVLGLKETLFVMEKEYDEAGEFSHILFTGKGWGHGVGLCQVGAFSMARAGADYQEILKKYYKGIKITKLY